MKTNQFYFDLPQELIAQKPSDRRGESRLIVLDRSSGRYTHSTMQAFPDFIDENTLLVVNNSRVRKARLFGTSKTGGRVEFLLVKKIYDTKWTAMVSKKKKQHPGKKFIFPGGITGEIAEDLGDLRSIQFSDTVDDTYLDKFGHIPLPPYIKREDNKEDWSRYQTVYAKKTGSAAAPTAGLHFTDEIISKIKERGIGIVPVTLHVGLGTFIPVRAENIEDHKMHEEEYEISSETAEQINTAKKAGKKILAVGTTSTRTLESAWTHEGIKPGRASTDLFIYPGYKFKVVDQMLTNFHTPDSSLIILVSAFAGTENIKKAYQEAVRKRYRFFSYGDAMFIR